MVICCFKSGSFVLNLTRGIFASNLNSYWVSVYSIRDSNKDFFYMSLSYSRKQAFSLFAKFCNWLLFKKYISY